MLFPFFISQHSCIWVYEYTGNNPLLLLGQINLNFCKSWKKMVGQQERGRNFNLCSYSLSKCPFTYWQQCQKNSATECSNFKIACNFSWSDLCCDKTNIFPFYSLFLFLHKSNCCWILCRRIEDRVWELDGEKKAAAQPSWPLSPLPSTCHQEEWTRFSKIIKHRPDSALLHDDESTLIQCHWLDLCLWKSCTLFCLSRAFCFS